MKPFPFRASPGLVLLLVLVAASGCSTIRLEPQPDSQDPYTVDAEATEQMIFWQVDGRGEVPLGARILGRTRQGLQRGLMDGGLRVSEDHGDVSVTFRTEAEEFDRSGNYYVFAGRASGDITLRPAGGQPPDLIGRLDAQARGQRQLGEDDALASLADALVGMLGEQTLGHADSVRRRVRAQELTLRLSWMRRQAGRDRMLADYSRRFAHSVGNLPGVLDCRLIEQDPAAASLKFRVVYLNDAFPQGLNNALLLQPELMLRNIR